MRTCSWKSYKKVGMDRKKDKAIKKKQITIVGRNLKSLSWKVMERNQPRQKSIKNICMDRTSQNYKLILYWVLQMQQMVDQVMRVWTLTCSSHSHPVHQGLSLARSSFSRDTEECYRTKKSGRTNGSFYQQISLMTLKIIS